MVVFKVIPRACKVAVVEDCADFRAIWPRLIARPECMTRPLWTPASYQGIHDPVGSGQFRLIPWLQGAANHDPGRTSVLNHLLEVSGGVFDGEQNRFIPLGFNPPHLPRTGPGERHGAHGLRLGDHKVPGGKSNFRIWNGEPLTFKKCLFRNTKNLKKVSEDRTNGLRSIGFPGTHGGLRDMQDYCKFPLGPSPSPSDRLDPLANLGGGRH